VFGNFTNEPVINLKNEQIETVELGYRMTHPKWKLNLGAYYTYWKNVSVLSNEYVQLEDNRQTRAMINGLNSLHKGVEMNVEYRPSEKFGAGAFVSIGDYKWKNDVTATLLSNDNVVVDTVYVYAKDILEGGPAQQQYSLYVRFRILNFFKLKTELTHYNKIYAGFDPVTRNNPSDRRQPYKIPDYTILNIYLGVPFKLFGSKALLQINGYNLCSNIHIVNGEDGIEHNLETFKGFWSFGRNFDFSLQINF
jgi:outer membrane receptor protein involved in Fe transport